MDQYKRLWKYITKILSLSSKLKNEKMYEKEIIEIFTDSDYLGWPSQRIISQYPIQMGSTKKCDIVLLDEDLKTPIIAIEIKLAISNVDGVKQLGSYMDRCNPRLKLGLLIKDSIYIFYDEDTGRSLESLSDATFSISFDHKDCKGEDFVRLFHYNNFSFEKIEDLCIMEKLQKESENKRNNKIQTVKKLLSDNSVLKDALFQYFQNEGLLEKDEIDLLEEALLKPSTESISCAQKPMKIETLDDIQGEIVGSNIKFIPTMKQFVERLSAEKHGYKYFIFNNGEIVKKDWNSQGKIDVTNVISNIKTNSYYKKHRNEIEFVILCHNADLFKESNHEGW